MRGFILGLIIGLMAGVVLAVAQSDRRQASVALTSGSGGPGEPVRLRLASAYPAALPHLGAGLGAIAKAIGRISDGRIQIQVQGPGQLVAALDAFDAVASGTVDAAFSSAAYWGRKSPSFEIFAGVPFGPDIASFLAWFENAGGRAEYEKLFAAFNIHAIACGVQGPTGALFSEDVQTSNDLLGRNLAAAGLAGRVLGALGATVTRAAPSDIAAGFADKSLDGALFAGPADDLALGLGRHGKVYYFPGWSRQSGLVDLMINANRWDALDPLARAQLETVCGASLKTGIADIENLQFTALKTLIRGGMRVERWPAPLVSKLRSTWERISLSLAKADPTFRRLIQSLNGFAEDRAIWQELNTPRPAPK